MHPRAGLFLSFVYFQRQMLKLIVPDELPHIAPINPLVAYSADVPTVALVPWLYAEAPDDERRSQLRKLHKRQFRELCTSILFNRRVLVQGIFGSPAN
ncbi:hypothetical protein [Mesorhizobium sp. SEMIA 3007]|uniref:hypothetical protein n=1 Tax=Mesorhizobium sp. SEMIA 3007 TaxID=1862350 RepID=UPI00114D1ADE|nr:hypothetical protein [Mesorhizobium sp. SEMIA 3007]